MSRTETSASVNAPSLRLPMTFDQEGLERDLETSMAVSWPVEEPFGIKDFVGSDVTIFHDGQWKGLALRSQDGDWRRTDPGGPGLKPYANTEVLENTPVFREIVESFQCHLRTVRLSFLPAGVNIEEHCDTFHAFRYGQIRMHVPVVTHPDVVLMIAGERCVWKAGELWYGDFSRLHRVENKSPQHRVHLIIDATINEWLLSLFPDDFVAYHRERGILFHETPIALPPADLANYQCEFVIPAGLMRGIFEMDDGIAGQFDGHLRMVDDELVMFVGERPLIALGPLGEGRFTYVGWGAERHLQIETEGGRVSKLELVLCHGHDETRIQLAVVDGLRKAS